MANPTRNWLIPALTLSFIILYGVAVAGWLRPAPLGQIVVRLEPIIFVSIGYCFGRLPSQQNEKLLKDELTRQAQKADAAQHAKEQLQQARETLEERVRNARTIIKSATPAASARGPAERADRTQALPNGEESLRASMAAALSVLSS